MTDIEKMRYMAQEIFEDTKPREQRLVHITQALKAAYALGRDAARANNKVH